MTATKKILLAGAGNIVERMHSTWTDYENKGIEIIAMDLRDDPSGKNALPKGTRFYNANKPDQLKDLLRLSPFDICYLSNFPSAHLATALRFDFFTNHFIFPKPVDSHINFLKTVHLDRGTTFQGIVSKMVVHDHYRNKPVVARLKSILKALHGKCGFIREIKIYITERPSTEDEWKRKGSLDDGLVLDLAPHALSVLTELLPTKFQWTHKDGHKYERQSISYDHVVGCYRARDNNCILKEGAETFAVIDLEGKEIINFTPKNSTQSMTLEPRKFHIMIVVGKGVSIDNESNPQNLKAFEITFDGSKVTGNFDTNAIGGAVDEHLLRNLCPDIDLRHRGLCLPFINLGEKHFNFGALNNDDKVVSDFQSFDDAYKVLEIITRALEHKTSVARLEHYETGLPSSDLINRLLTKGGLDPRWHHAGPPTHLVFGKAPEDPID